MDESQSKSSMSVTSDNLVLWTDTKIAFPRWIQVTVERATRVPLITQHPSIETTTDSETILSALFSRMSQVGDLGLTPLPVHSVSTTYYPQHLRSSLVSAVLLPRTSGDASRPKRRSRKRQWRCSTSKLNYGVFDAL